MTNMRWHKITALMYHDSLAIRRVRYRIMDLVYFPITTIIIWGLFSIYSRNLAPAAGLIVFIINIFWAFAHLAQSTTNVLMMEDIWSGSQKQLFMSGITEFEYITARLLSATISSTAIIIMLVSLSLLFGINFFHISMLLLIIITLIGSLALAIIVAALVFYLGREYGFLVWSAMQLFIMLSAPFFPKETFPKILVYISYAMPFTAVFEAARGFVMTGTIATNTLIWGFCVAMVYFAISWPIYYFSFKRARKIGMLAKMH